MLYGLDVCPVNVRDKYAFDFVLTRVLMKLFNTGSIDIIHDCCDQFNIRTVSALIAERKRNFLSKFIYSTNVVCNLFVNNAKLELL